MLTQYFLDVNVSRKIFTESDEFFVYFVRIVESMEPMSVSRRITLPHVNMSSLESLVALTMFAISFS